jgi:hypothetical protein
MKYLLLAYGDQSAWDTVDVNSPEFLAACKFYEDMAAELTATGELLGTEGLAHPALSRTIRRTESGPVASEGPFAESKEVLASFAIVDCDSHDRAMALANRIVDAVGDTVEVRPIMAGPEDLRPAG